MAFLGVGSHQIEARSQSADLKIDTTPASLRIWVEPVPIQSRPWFLPVMTATWTNFRAIGKTATEAKALYEQMKRLENAGAYAAELEVVPHNLATFLCSQTSLLLMSLGSGTGCDTQFLFSDDILGDYEDRPPRHAKAYRNLLAEYRRLQQERVDAFREYISDVQNGRFPEDSHLISMDEAVLNEIKETIRTLV